MDEIGKTNQLYWKSGTAKDMSKWHPKRSKVTSNRIFSDLETAIPILTSEPPEPTVIGVPDNMIKEQIKKGLSMAYEIKYKMQQKLQKAIRSWAHNRLGVIKYKWDEDKGFMTYNVLTRNIGIDKRATSKDDCEYIWEMQESTVEWLTETFPIKKDKILSKYGKDNPKRKIKYLEFWGGGGEWVCWKLDEIILDKMKNPNWNYGEPAHGEKDTFDYIPEVEGENLFDTPQFPYLFLNVFNTGETTGIYDETSLIEESIPLQEGVNQLEQQIIDLNEGQKRVWMASGEAISEKQFQQLIDKTGDLGVYLDRKAPAGGLTQVQSGKPDASLFNNLNHLLSEIDNIIGIHSTTRGERGQQETLGGRQLLMGSDYGRLDLIVRNVEQLMEEWYGAYLHMIKVYADQPEVLEDGMSRIELTGEQIPVTTTIMVKKGSTLPTDDITRMQNALQLASMRMIDPETLFEEMDYPDPQGRMQKLVQWMQMTGQIMPQGAMGGGAGGGQEQLDKIDQLLKSREFQALPDEEKQAALQKAKQAVEQIKQGQQ